jgi:hypothetical protein
VSSFHKGKLEIISFKLLVNGAIGAKYGTPKDFILHKNVNITKAPNTTPNNPKEPAKRINTNLFNLTPNDKEYSGIANEPIPVRATIIINIGLTILAATAA